MRMVRWALLAAAVLGMVLGLFCVVGDSVQARTVGPGLASLGTGPQYMPQADQGLLVADGLPGTDASQSTLGTDSSPAFTEIATLYFPMIASRFQALREPNDPDYWTQWALDLVEASKAWAITTGNGVVVAIVDTGVQLDHPDLVGNLTSGWDFVDGDAVPADQHGHGTHVAGIAGATTDNEVGIAGMGWNVTLMPVRVLDAAGNGNSWGVGQGIRYAADHGAKVINLSLGGYSGDSELRDAVEYAQTKGALVIAAAGNDSISAPFYPAFYPNVLGVSATDRDDLPAWFSNYGDYVDLSAPGESITSTLPGSSYGLKSGTSMAAPMVSGLAALIWAQQPAATASEVAAMIINGAEDLGSAGWDPIYGWGRINAVRSFHPTSSASAESITTPEDVSERTVVGAPAATVSLPPTGYLRGELIVRVDRSLAALQRDRFFAGYGLSVQRVGMPEGLYLLRVPEGQEIALAAVLRKLANVVYAQPNYVLSTAQ